VLDLGTHLGGFAVHAARAGVTAIGLDQSAKALDFARGNAARCGLSERLTFAQGDLFGPLDQPELAGPFGVIVVDPPKIAGSARDLPRATRALAACLSNLAPRVAPRGYLVVCSCSHHLSGVHLDAAVACAAAGPGPWPSGQALITPSPPATSRASTCACTSTRRARPLEPRR
jgi:23S rRNA (cytosine1962-C5)-methyltransferase